MRRQIVDQLIQQVPFDLPEDLVRRQEKSTLQRQVSEMRNAGFSDTQIRAREAEIRANAHESTLRSLKEFFLLAKIAEAEGVKVEDDDIALEVAAIAARTDESPRRVRSRLEKEGRLDDLATQSLLGPFRGEPAVDRRAVVAVLVALSDAAEQVPGLVSVDLNPLMVVDGVPVAVDALVELADEPGAA